MCQCVNLKLAFVARWMEIKRAVKSDTAWKWTKELDWEAWTYVNVWRCHQIIVCMSLIFSHSSILKGSTNLISTFGMHFIASYAHSNSDCQWWFEIICVLQPHTHHRIKRIHLWDDQGKKNKHSKTFSFHLTSPPIMNTWNNNNNQDARPSNTQSIELSRNIPAWSSFVFERSFIFVSRVNWAEACDNNEYVFETGAREKRKATNNEPNSSQKYTCACIAHTRTVY